MTFFCGRKPKKGKENKKKKDFPEDDAFEEEIIAVARENNPGSIIIHCFKIKTVLK